MPAVVVNLFGGPGTGKSTLALGITHELKRLRHEAQFIAEEAKYWAFYKHHIGEPEQLEITWRQYDAERRYYEHADFIVTDSPLEICAFYSWYRNRTDDYSNIVRRLRERHPHIEVLNYWIVREKEYNPVGRYQTEEEALLVDREMQAFMAPHGLIRTDIHNPLQFIQTHLL